MCFSEGCRKISWTEKKSNLEVRRAAGVQRTLMKTIRQRQLDFFGHVMRRQDIEALVLTGKVKGDEQENDKDRRIWTVCVHVWRIT